MSKSKKQASAFTDAIELMFFAYRDFIADPDAILEEHGFGRAHHRVAFCRRQPRHFHRRVTGYSARDQAKLGTRFYATSSMPVISTSVLAPMTAASGFCTSRPATGAARQADKSPA